MKFYQQIAPYILSVVIMRIGWFATMPFVTLYVYNNISKDPKFIGLFLGSALFIASFGGVIGGVLSDKFSTKKVMLATTLIAGSLFFSYGVINQVNAIFLFIVIGGATVGMTSFEAASKSYISSNISAAHKIRAFNLRYMALNIGAVIGPLIGAVIIKLNHPALPFMLCGCAFFSIIVLLSMIKVKHKEHHEKTASKLHHLVQEVFVNKNLLIMTLMATIMMLAIVQLEVTIPQVMATRISNYQQGFGYFLAAGAIGVVILQIPVSILMEKYSLFDSAKVASIIFSISFVVMALADNLTWFLIAAIIFCIGEVLYSSTNNMLIDKLAPAHKRGLYYGVTGFSSSAFCFGPALCGLVLKYFNGVVLYLIIAVIMLCSIPMLLSLEKSIKLLKK